MKQNPFHVDRLLLIVAFGFIAGIYIESECRCSFGIIALILSLAMVLFAVKKYRIGTVIGAVFVGMIWVWWLLLPIVFLEQYPDEVTIGGVVTNGGEGDIWVETYLLEDEALAIKTTLLVDTIYGDRTYEVGERIVIKGVLSEPMDETNPGGFSQKDYLKSMGIHMVLKASESGVVMQGNTGIMHMVGQWRKNIDKHLQQLPEEEYGIAQALLLGDKGAIDRDFYSLTQKMGIAHVFAVSGLHIGFLVGLVLWLLKKLKWDKKWSAVILLGTLLFAYCAIVGFSSSVVRASTMAMTALLLGNMLRFKDSMSIWALAMLVVLVGNPFAIYGVGFQLSFGLVWGILFLHPFAERILRKVSWMPLRNALVLMITTQLISLPLIAWHFYTVSALGWLFNLLLVPMIGVLFPLLWILVFLGGVPIFGSFAFYMTEMILWVIKNGIELSAGMLGTGHFYIGKPPILFLAVWFLMLIFLRYGKENTKVNMMAKAVAFGICLAVLVLPQAKESKVTFVDVGQGNGAVLFGAQGECWVFDTGKYTDTIARFLRYEGINHIDGVVISHSDLDHIGGLHTILRDFRVDKLYTTKETLTDEVWSETEFDNFLTVDVVVIDEICAMGGKDINVELIPLKEGDLLALAEIRGHTIAFCGDMTKDEIAEFLLLGKKADICMVPHHGSRNNLQWGMYERMDSKLAIISVGRENAYGHPHKEVEEALRKSEISYLRTDQAGAITVYLKDQRQVECMMVK